MPATGISNSSSITWSGPTKPWGILREDLLPGLRQVTKNRAVFYFVIDEAAGQVRILAIFFGGQDHLAQMLRRVGRGG